VAKDIVSTVSRKQSFVAAATNFELAYSDVLAGAWCSHNLNERFREAMRKARVELGPGGNFAAVLKRAWALDPDLRGQFGDAVSSGLRKMWASTATRAAQSDRIKQTYTPALRRLRSEALRKNWADAGFREKMMRSSVRLPNGRFGARGPV
jgi:hypothetical protein